MQFQIMCVVVVVVVVAWGKGLSHVQYPLLYN
jgi:hypothetical protein